MSLPITSALVRAAYEYLRHTPPFSNWRMPPGESVHFRVTHSIKVQGAHQLDGDVHTVWVSSRRTGHTDTLMSLMAHEMVHMVCDKAGVRSEHGAEFRRRADLVCRYHGWDPKHF